MSWMSTTLSLGAVVGLLALAGCTAPTPYQPTADGYGYSEQQLESNRYRVTFSGNSVMSASVVISNPAILAAFCNAVRVTLVGSIMPFVNISP